MLERLARWYLRRRATIISGSGGTGGASGKWIMPSDGRMKTVYITVEGAGGVGGGRGGWSFYDDEPEQQGAIDPNTDN